MYATCPICQNFPSSLLMKNLMIGLFSFCQPAQLLSLQLPSASDVSFTPTNSETNSPSGGVKDSDALMIADKYRDIRQRSELKVAIGSRSGALEWARQRPSATTGPWRRGRTGGRLTLLPRGARCHQQRLDRAPPRGWSRIVCDTFPSLIQTASTLE